MSIDTAPTGFAAAILTGRGRSPETPVEPATTDPDPVVPDQPSIPDELTVLLRDCPPLVGDPWLDNGRWTFTPHLFRGEIFALMATAVLLTPRRFEAWPDGDDHQVRCYGTTPTGVPVVVATRTHRQVRHDPTWAVPEDVLLGLAEQERQDMAGLEELLAAVLTEQAKAWDKTGEAGAEAVTAVNGASA